MFVKGQVSEPVIKKEKFYIQTAVQAQWHELYTPSVKTTFSFGVFIVN
jgi:hypothetical protein